MTTREKQFFLFPNGIAFRNGTWTILVQALVQVEVWANTYMLRLYQPEFSQPVLLTKLYYTTNSTET